MVKTLTVQQPDGTCVALELWNSKEPSGTPRIYVAKRLNDGSKILAYTRGYMLVGEIMFAKDVDAKWNMLWNHSAKIQEWKDWTGGGHDEPGDAVWFDLGKVLP